MATSLIKSLAMKAIDSTGNYLLRPPKSGFGYFKNHGSRMERKIALTFDDGPSRPSTEMLVDVMDELQVRGTFFCIGLQVSAHPDLLQRMYATGHIIGNHSMGHQRKDSLQISSGEHIDASEKAISAVIGCRPRLYRPPWGWLTPWDAQRLTRRGYSIIGWDVFTLDWKLPEIDGDTLARGILRDVQPGSIILMHDSYAMTTNSKKAAMTHTVKKIVPHLRNEGYEFVTIPDLLGIPAYTPLV